MALDNKVLLVTGGGSGIGRGVVDAAIAAGARVSVLEISGAKAASLEAQHGDAVAVTVGDATSLTDNERAVAAARELGGLDSLVCCVGLWDYFTSIVDVPKEALADAFDELYGVNVKSYLLAVKASVDELIEREGTIVLTASNAAFYSAGGGSLYTSSKFAVRGLVIQLAYELAPRVRVNAVAPGGTPTELAGLKSLGQDGLKLCEIPDVDVLIRSTNPLGVVPSPADHAEAYLYLADRDRTVAVTGTIIHSDGGLGVRGLTQAAGLTEPAEVA